jgi:hypothetical protein
MAFFAFRSSLLSSRAYIRPLSDFTPHTPTEWSLQSQAPLLLIMKNSKNTITSVVSSFSPVEILRLTQTVPPELQEGKERRRQRKVDQPVPLGTRQA